MSEDGRTASSVAPTDDSGLIRVESVTVRHFRGITQCTLDLEPSLTLLVGRNGAGKSRLLRALALACGAIKADADDFTVDGKDEPSIDLVLAPGFGQDSFDDRVGALFGSTVQPLPPEGRERIAWRTTVSQSAEGWGGRAESRFLTFDAAASTWVLRPNAPQLNAGHRGLLSADLVGTGRDLAAELSRPGSPIRRVLNDLEVADEARSQLQAELQALSGRIVESSKALDAVRQRLTELDDNVAGMGRPVMSPLPSHLEELARMIEIGLDNTGMGPLPMRLHGSGARSLASLQVQSVLYERNLGRDGSDLPTHPLTLAEEPEAHLHPQACFDLIHLLRGMTGQVVVSTHSSHLVTVAPTESTRLIRQDNGVTVLRSLRPVDAEPTTPAALRLDVSAVEWEKLKRLVERPFGELLFASAVVVGDGASERAFLPHLLRHSLGHGAASLCVVDPGGMSQAGPLVKFAQAAGIPCLLFCDADPAGSKDESKLPTTAVRIWVTGDRALAGDLEHVLAEHDAQWCVDQCDSWFPQIQGSAHERLDLLKGTYGHPLGRAFVRDFPDIATWPAGFQSLVAALRPAVAQAGENCG